MEILKNRTLTKKHFASVSFGKDSLCMLFKLIEKKYPLDEVVFFNTGMEFEAIYDVRDKVIPTLNSLGISFKELSPKAPFLFSMFEKPVKKKGTDIIDHYGYSWCGGTCRWGTSQKVNALKSYTKNGIDYVGIAADELHRINKEARPNRFLPLMKWGITEPMALDYCYSLGYRWEEFGYRLYDILKRVSCWCCGNKNLEELYNYYRYLPYYWNKLKELQSRTTRPYRRDSGKTIFDLERDFQLKAALV